MIKSIKCVSGIYEAIDKGKIRKALALVDDNIDEYGEYPSFLMAEAMVFEELGEYKTAILLLKKVVEIAPDSSEVYPLLVKCYEKQEEYNKKNENIIIIDTDDCLPVEYSQEIDIYKTRKEAEILQRKEEDPLVSIFFLAYNNLETLTKPAIESLIKYTNNIDYELFLIDNGSTDGTFQYFKHLKINRKKIYRVTKNIGGMFGFNLIEKIFFSNKARGKYIVYMPNDVLVTKNWLDNMIICAKSIKRAGIIVPVCDNCSNYQTVDLEYADFNDMQDKAAAFNISDSRKWQERMRIIPVVCLLPRAACQLNHFYDTAFVYSFADDDMSINYRRNGYKLILCGDTFIHHEGSTVVGKNVEKNKMDLLMGRETFRKKHHGIDPWDDMNNYEWIMCQQIIMNQEMMKYSRNLIKILGVDVRCGAPLLTLKNELRFRKKINIKSAAYTSNGKYYLDLNSVCNDGVLCGAISDIEKSKLEKNYDYIICGEYIDSYNYDFFCIHNLMSMLKKNGRIVIKFRNFPGIIEWTDIFEKMCRPDLMKYGLGEMFRRFADKYKYRICSFKLMLGQEENAEWSKLAKLIEDSTFPAEAGRIEYRERYAFVKGYYIVVLEKGNGDN